MEENLVRTGIPSFPTPWVLVHAAPLVVADHTKRTREHASHSFIHSFIQNTYLTLPLPNKVSGFFLFKKKRRKIIKSRLFVGSQPFGDTS